MYGEEKELYEAITDDTTIQVSNGAKYRKMKHDFKWLWKIMILSVYYDLHKFGIPWL